MNRIPGADFYFVADSCMATWMPQKHSRLALRLLPRYRIYLEHEAAICTPGSPTTLLYIAPFQKRDYQTVYNLPDSRFTDILLSLSSLLSLLDNETSSGAFQIFS